MRLIDADRLRDDFLGMPNCYNGFSDTYDKAMIVDMIDEQPTIKPPTGYRVLPGGSGWEYFGKAEDTVEVVRCKDCVDRKIDVRS